MSALSSSYVRSGRDDSNNIDDDSEHLDSSSHQQRDSKKEQANSSANASSQHGRWTKEEHEKFVKGIVLFGRNWKKVEEFIGTRSGAQIRSHAQKYFSKAAKEAKEAEKKKVLGGSSSSSTSSSCNHHHRDQPATASSPGD